MTGHAVRLLKAVGALAVLIAIIVGVPVLLVTLGLVPHELPSFDEVISHLTVRDDGQLVQVVLAAGAWVCWALFTASTAAELAGLVRTRPAARCPAGLGVFQRPAAALVAAVAVGLSVVPTAVGAASSGGLVAHPPLPVATVPSELSVPAQRDVGVPVIRTASAYSPQEAPVPPMSTSKSYQVQRRDTLWAIAERYLGDPLRYPEIVQLNPSVIGPDNEIVPGTVLTMPSDAMGLTSLGDSPAPTASTAAEEVTVEPGDTLWDLAAEVTGSGENWRQAWEVNKGRAEPGGATFTDPSLIRPGWTLSIPRAGGSEAPESSPPSPPTPESAPPAVEPTPPGSGASTTAAPAPATTVPVPPDPVAPSVEPTPAQPVGPAADATPELSTVAYTGGGLLLAGVSLAALLRYRRRQFRHRRPGRLISATPPGLLRAERALQLAGSAGSADVTWLDQALRSLVQGSVEVEGARLPDVVAVCMTDDVLTLMLTSPAPQAPRPWTVDRAGTRWSIRRDDPLTYDEDQRARFFSPFPTLASVGWTAEGEYWLLDLERVGAMSLSGDAERCLSLARFLAAELAHNTWSEMLQVTLVGFGEELAEINPDRLNYTDEVEKAVRTLNRRLESVREAAEAINTDVLTGRLHDIAADTWAPHVLLIAPQAVKGSTELTRLLTTLQQYPGRCAIAVVLAHDTDHDDDVRWQLIVDGNGALRIPALELELLAQQVPAEEAAQLAEALALASVTEDRPVPPARTDKPWDVHADACGGLRVKSPSGTRQESPEPNRPGDDPTLDGGSRTSASSDSVLPLPTQTYLERAATTEQDLRAMAPATNDGIRRQVEDADPELDADLADWADPSCPRPKLTLLGPVQVSAQGSLPDRNPRRQFYTEIVAYLATRPGGVTSERYATAIWPDEPDVVGKTKVRQSISVVRAWLGADPVTGDDYLPSGLSAAAAGRYRINGILIDAELFRRLRLRGLARGTEGIADLRAALDLVTGRPFDLPAPRRGAPGGYSWLTDEDSRLDHEYAAMIVDVAHTVATHDLAAGQPELAAAVGCIKDLGQGLRPERICPCPSSGESSVRSSRLKPCRWCSRPVSPSPRSPVIWESTRAPWATG